MAGPWYDRLVAALKFDGTCTFLLFISHGFMYTGTIALLLYQTFATSAEGLGAATSLTLFLGSVYGCSAAILAFLTGGALYFGRKLATDAKSDR
jgi:hypothetical protein